MAVRVDVEPALPVRTTYLIGRLSRLVQRELEHRLVELCLSVP